MKDVFFLIPARAGSKGLPGKNYLEICEKPLVWWSIEAARISGVNSQIAVSTNDQHIMEVAESFNSKHGANTVHIIDRPDDISKDSSSTEEAMSHAIDTMFSLGYSFEYISLLQPTSPARPNNLIGRCFKEISSYRSDSLLTVSEHTPFFWKYSDGGARSSWPNNKRKMRQDLKKSDMQYHDNGNVYIIRADKFRGNGRITNRPLLYETDRFESMQIDTLDDFALIEMAAKYYGGFI